MRIKAVLFDLGNTLVKYDFGVPEEVFQRVLTSLGISRSLNDVYRAFLKATRDAEDLNLLSAFGKMRCEDYWIQWDSLVLKNLGVTEHHRLAETVQSKWLDFVNCTLYSEVKPVLAELKRAHLKVGLISTAYEEEIHLILEKAKLEDTTFDALVGVDTIQKAKPHPDVFKYAIHKLEVKPMESIFVGDNVEADCRGAKNAGLHALLIDRRAKQHSDFKTISNLKELLNLIS